MRLITRFARRRDRAPDIGDPHTPQTFPRGPDRPWWAILMPIWIPLLVVAGGFLLLRLLSD